MNPDHPDEKPRAPDPTQEFLMTGGAAVTMLSLGEARPPTPRPEATGSREKTRDIMELYGSEFGEARSVS